MATFAQQSAVDFVGVDWFGKVTGGLKKARAHAVQIIDPTIRKIYVEAAENTRCNAYRGADRAGREAIAYTYARKQAERMFSERKATEAELRIFLVVALLTPVVNRKPIVVGDRVEVARRTMMFWRQELAVYQNEGEAAGNEASTFALLEEETERMLSEGEGMREELQIFLAIAMLSPGTFRDRIDIARWTMRFWRDELDGWETIVEFESAGQQAKPYYHPKTPRPLEAVVIGNGQTNGTNGHKPNGHVHTNGNGHHHS